eukprot:15323898-Ditylum_brightwellii.AAC.1
MPACKAQLKISGEIITGKIEKCIRDAWCQVEIRKYCKGKFGWNRRTFNTVDWDALERLHHNNVFYKKKFITKYIYERLSVKGEAYSGRVSKICPCCNTSDETTQHFLTCSENVERWNALEEDLQL